MISYCDETNIKEEYQPLIDGITKDYELQSYGRMLNYLEATQKHMLSHLQTVRNRKRKKSCIWTIPPGLNLELVTPLHDTGKAITLWSFLDECRSAMGSRELRRWIEKPLVDQESIEQRL